MNLNKVTSQNSLNKVFNGKDNYKIGFIFLIGYLLTYFSKMQANNVQKKHSFLILIILALVCSSFY